MKLLTDTENHNEAVGYLIQTLVDMEGGCPLEPELWDQILDTVKTQWRTVRTNLYVPKPIRRKIAEYHE
jgi:hypothetical protein